MGSLPAAKTLRKLRNIAAPVSLRHRAQGSVTALRVVRIEGLQAACEAERLPVGQSRADNLWTVASPPRQ